MKRQLKRLVEAMAAPVAPLSWRMRRSPSLLVLMYHRVLPPEHPDRSIEQPGMYVSPATLDMHLTILERHFPIVHLDDWLRKATSRESLPTHACALTFDDGWRDNFEHAYPVLQRHQAPATIFLVSTMTGTHKAFWPNRLARALVRLRVGESLPEPLEAVLAPVLQRARGPGKWSLEDLDEAVALAKGLDEASLDTALRVIEERAQTPEDTRAVLNEDELRIMAGSGLVRFGSHTRTHFRLRGTVPREVLEQEIAVSAAEIGTCVGHEASLFCYPNGDLTADAVDVVRRNYIGAVTTRKGWYTAGADPYLIPRMGVHEDVSNRPAGFLARISGLV